MFVSVLLVRIALAELRRGGFNPEPLLLRARIAPEELADIRSRISLDRVDALIAEAVEISNDPALGLSAAMNMPESALQMLGHLLVACHTIRQALSFFFQYANLLVEGSHWELREDGDVASLSYDRPFPESPTARVGAEGMIAGALRVGLHFVPDLRPTEVWFKHSAPDDESKHQQLLKCPVYFGRPTNALFVPRAALDIEQLHADDTMIKLLREGVGQVMRETGAKETVAERVRILLRYETDLSRVDLESISLRLGLARSTVRAKLAAEGLKLSKLIDEARCRLACDELRRSDVNIKDLAARVGFAERSAFHRAFRRWTNQTPAQFSQSARGEESDDDPDIGTEASWHQARVAHDGRSAS